MQHKNYWIEHGNFWYYGGESYGIYHAEGCFAAIVAGFDTVEDAQYHIDSGLIKHDL